MGKNIPDVYDILLTGTEHARRTTNETLNAVRHAMRIDYFDDRASMIRDWENWIAH